MPKIFAPSALASRLFWKIFFWFWGATIVIGFSVYFFVRTTQPDPMPPHWRRSVASSLSNIGQSVVRVWESEGQRGLANAFDGLDRHWQNGTWLYDATGRELSGAKVPGPPPGVPAKAPPPGAPTEERLRTVAMETSADQTTFYSAGMAVIAARSIQGKSGQRYVFVALIPPPPSERSLAAPQQQFFVGLIAFLLSGLICFGLVRYLTAPLLNLKEATQRFAGGDLHARTYAAQQGRRDEVADLGRDFDIMAEHIESLIQSQRQLLADISHELRSPLTRLNMALALSRRCATQHGNSDEMQAALNRIGRETKQLDALIGQLLDLARLEGDHLSEQEECDLEALLHEVIADANFEAEAKQCRVQLLESEPCFVRGAYVQLHSAFENIVRNAIRYTAMGTTVEVRLKVQATSEKQVSSAIVVIRDRGNGVPAESLERLFLPFYRVESARDRKSGGVGLGLAITERAIRLHGGEVHASNHPEGGLQIEVQLPLSHSSSGLKLQ